MAKHRKQTGWLTVAIIAIGVVGSALLIWSVFNLVPANNANPLQPATTTAPADPPPTTTQPEIEPYRPTQGATSSPVSPTKKGSRPSPSPPVDQGSTGY